ncbi:MAG TPA: hypothetical protein VFR23_21960 [Jiangellaceae bacterium]|nr:hypothetical protein [Jiangellaceae bacterium]
METTQQWCAGCASVREFVLVPDSESTEYACTGCDAALVVAGGQPSDVRTAVLV